MVYFYPGQIKANIDAEPILKPFFKDVSATGDAYANSIYFEDPALNPSLYATKNYAMFNLVYGLENLDDTADSTKGISSLYQKNHTPALNVSTLYPTPVSYLNTLNLYRSNFEDFS
jgi:hypothetical protein